MSQGLNLKLEFEWPSDVKVIDVHVHLTGRETPDSVSKALDTLPIEKIVAFSPYPGLMTGHVMTYEEFIESVEFASRLQREFPDKIIAFAFIEPRISKDSDELVKLLEWAIATKELRGVKMIPAEWYPSDPFLDRFYAKIEELGVPILFHCGISWGFPYASKFSKPVEYEYLAKFPNIRFAIAHICWPWVDEALALAGKFLYAIAGGDYTKCRLFIDTTPGTPPLWRAEALRKTIVYLGPHLFMYGTDCFGADNVNCMAQHMMLDYHTLKRELGVDDTVIKLFFRENALRYLKLP